MKNFNYKKEIDDIHADAFWKAEVKQKLYLQQIPKKMNVRRYAFATLLCVFAIIIGIWYSKQNGLIPITADIHEKKPAQELALLEVGGIPNKGSMGYEAVMQLYEQDMKWDSPWSFDNDIYELPVIKNINQKDATGTPNEEISESRLHTIGTEYAQRLGFTIRSSQTDQDGFYRIYCEEATISVEQQDSVAVWFTQDYINEHAYSLGKKGQTKAEALDSLQNAYANFAAEIGFEQPKFQTNLQYGVDEGEIEIEGWEYQIYEGKGSQVEQLIARDFHSVYFYSDENNQIWGMRFYTVNSDQTIGNYPIINLQEATTRLKKNEFYATAPMGDFDHIVHVDMVYSTNCTNNCTNENFIPYYKFYAPLKNTTLENTGSLITYGAYYVPAIQSEYVKK